MAFTVHPAITTGWRQRLKNLGPGALIAASDVRVYLGEKLIRLETKEGRRIHRKIGGHHGNG